MAQIMQKDAIIQQVIHLAELDPRIEIVWIYGSRAKLTAQENSDYDFAVAFATMPMNSWDKRLQSELLALEWSERLNLPEKKLSVADINQVPLMLAMGIITTGNVLLVKNGLRLAREENRITSMWEIDYKYHLQHYG